MADDQGQSLKAKQGDCISSMADEQGFFWETLWNHPNNGELKKLRKNPNVLAPGDMVFVPPLRTHSEAGATGQRHTFKKKGTPAVTRFCFKKDGEPQANEPYVLDTGEGPPIRGQTDGEGMVILKIPPTASHATITVGEGKKARTYKVQLGSMDPVETEAGLRKRLMAVGCDPGAPEQDNDGGKLKQAIRKFQAKQKMKLTGVPDDALRAKLLEVFGC
jgi:N-acetylmuramoyl-L-alanine amidase